MAGLKHILADAGLGIRAKVKSPIMYPGGKGRLLSSLRPLRPAAFESYHEVCAGGLANFLDLRSSGFVGHACLLDASDELIRSHEAIKSDPDAVASAFLRHAAVHSTVYFRRIRRAEWFSMTDAEVAGRFLYLNRTCFNALYRVDRRGRFVVGLGHDRSGDQRHRLDVDNLRAVSLALRDAELVAADFTAVIAKARSGDFCFMDPPYPDGYCGYTAMGFTQGDHRRLRDVCDELHRMGVMWMQTNADCEFIRQLYHGFKIVGVEAKRMSKNPCGHCVAKEVVITNY